MKKDTKKLWELICYLVGIAGFILVSTIAVRFPAGSSGAIAMVVLELVCMAILCAGLVTGVFRNRKFTLNNFLRGAVLIAVVTDMVFTVIRLFR